MKPLAEQVQHLEGAERQLAELFAVAEPVRSDPFRKRRILVRVTKQPLPKRVGYRTALTATLLLGVATATAAISIAPIKAAYNRRSSGHLNSTQSQSLQSPRGAFGIAAPRPEPIKQSILPVGDAPAEPIAVPQTASSASTPKLHVSVQPKHPASSEDPSQVVSAIRALRNEHNPARAKALLNGYLQSHPQGALTEDALALSIEAAMATNDSRSVELARTYLVKYPGGRYRALATKALGQ